MTIGQRLKEARLAAGLSQRQLCGDTITRNMLSQIENGVARPSMDTLQTLAQRLGKPVSFFLEDGRSREEEEYLLKALTCLEQAQQAIAQGRLPLAASLLDDCAVAGAKTPYFLPVLERHRLVLLAQARPEAAEEIVAALPPADEELLLRVQVALKRQQGALAATFLEAAQDRESCEWNLLRGQAAFAQGEYRSAAEYFHKAEQSGVLEVYSWLEQCYRQLEDYKLAYHYACKQK